MRGAKGDDFWVALVWNRVSFVQSGDLIQFGICTETLLKYSGKLKKFLARVWSKIVEEPSPTFLGKNPSPGGGGGWWKIGSLPFNFIYFPRFLSMSSH